MTQRIGALWQKKKDNKTYLTGEIEVVAGIKTKIVVFKNEKKKDGSNQPDWSILVSKPIPLKSGQAQVSYSKIQAEEL